MRLEVGTEQGDWQPSASGNYNPIMNAERSIVVFDLGGVLIDWDPRYLYRKLFGGNDKAMEHFLGNVCSPFWNEQQDAGRTFADACASLKVSHPKEAQLIDAWIQRYDEMLGGEIPGTVEILAELKGRGIPLYVLSNWSTETFPFAVKRFEWLSWFRGILLSGEVRILKPDRRIFNIFIERFGIDPARSIYIDDRSSNVQAAVESGMRGVLFTDSGTLRRELTNSGVIGG